MASRFDDFADGTDARGGTVHLRLEVEGFADMWTTSSALVGTTTGTTLGGRNVRLGLSPADAFELSEQPHLRDATLDVSGATFTIAEPEDQSATFAFARRAAVVSWLTASVTDTTTVWTVADPAAFSVNDRVHIGTETVRVTATGTTTITVQRAVWNTKAQYHYPDDYGPVAITDAPGAIRNRRVRLFAYFESDVDAAADSDGDGIPDGTLLWRGVVLRPPTTSDGVTWRLQVEPRTHLLKQEIAAESTNPIRIRGLYYHFRAPFRVQLFEHATATAGTFGVMSGVLRDTVYVTGHFDDDTAFVDAVNVAVQAAITATFTSTDTNIAIIGRTVATADGPGGWVWAITTGATARYTGVLAVSPLDGEIGIPAPLYDDPLSGTVVGVVGTTTTYYQRMQAPWHSEATHYGWVVAAGPRRFWGHTFDAGLRDPTASATAPTTRLHLSRDAGFVAGDRIQIDGLETDPGQPNSFVINAVDVADPPSVDLVDERSRPMQALNTEHDVRFQHALVDDGTLESLRAELVTEAVKANYGNVPFITGPADNDADTASWATEVAAAALDRAYTAHRAWSFTEPVTLEDLWAEEAKLLGGYFRLDAFGRIDFRRLLTRAPTDPAVVTLDSSNIIPRPEWPAWSQEPEGVVNIIEILDGYDAREDEHAVRFEVRDAISISLHKQRNTLTVAPKSANVGVPMSYLDAVEVAQTPLHFFSTNYQFVVLRVAWSVFTAALIGETVSITDARVPDTNSGTRGLNARRGIIVRREWAVPGHGTLTVMLHEQDVRGYAPAARLTGATLVSGNTWDLTITAALYAPSGSFDLDFFAANDITEVMQRDALEPLSDTATVVSIASSTSVRVTFDTGAPWGGSFTGKYDLLFRDDASAYTPTTNEARFAYIADGAFLLYDASGAKVFAP